MSYQILGRCSLCGGTVTVPHFWHGIYPPQPTCQKCGATAQLPTLPMQPKNERTR